LSFFEMTVDYPHWFETIVVPPQKLPSIRSHYLIDQQSRISDGQGIIFKRKLNTVFPSVRSLWN
jgi:hypothetical protein